ncbi:hypothetical protein CUMW_147490 [Citrus unshiu]|nr:hypothetical protein CUMW_147490 [Citrus unshiu]
MNMRSVNLLLLVLLFAVVLPIPSILAAATSKEVDAAKETNRNPYETNANAMPENLEAADKQSNSQVMKSMAVEDTGEEEEEAMVVEDIGEEEEEATVVEDIGEEGEEATVVEDIGEEEEAKAVAAVAVASEADQASQHLKA